MKNNEIMVSIHCCAYNQETYIRQCLDGFVTQKTDFCFEAIVHDDASTDKTAVIIKEYAEKYPDIIKPIYQKENQYSKCKSNIRKIMSEHTHGKYIAMCEGDDYWVDPYKLQKQVDFLEANPEYSMCFHRANILNESTDLSTNLACQGIEDRDYSADELFREWVVPTASMLFRREVVNYELKHTEKILNGDIVTVLTCASIGKIRGFSDTMSVYRVQPNGVTYDTTARNRRLKRYPEHFMFIKENFPIVSSKYVNLSLGRAYFGRVFSGEKMQNMMKDWSRALYYAPYFTMKQSLYIVYRGIRRILRLTK